MKLKSRVYSELVKEFDDMYESEICKERSLPDIRDGMRMVQRRIYWAFLSMSKERRFKLTKSASLVGDVIKFHPHGDSSIYDSIVKEVHYVVDLIRGKGNWGCRWASIPSKPAKMRYTECCLKPKAENYFRFYKYSSFIMNECGLEEPKYLPLPFPHALQAGFFGICKSGQSAIPSYKASDLNKRVIWLLNSSKTGKGPIIKPWFGSKFTMEGDFENILKTGKGKVSVFPELIIDNKKKKIKVIGICPYITNVGTILEKISIDAKYGKYVSIKDLSSKKTDIIIEYKTKYMKNVPVDFKTLVNFIKSKFTYSVTYNIITYKGLNEYPNVSVDEWLMLNYEILKKVRLKELNSLIKKLNSQISLNNSISKVRPIIKDYLSKYEKFTKSIIKRLRSDITKLIKDEKTTSQIMQISVTKLLECNIDNAEFIKEVKNLEKLKTDENIKSNILEWMKTI